MNSSASIQVRLIYRMARTLGLLALIAIYFLKALSWIGWEAICERERNKIRFLESMVKMFQKQNHRLPETTEGLKVLEVLEVCPDSLRSAGTWQKLIDIEHRDFWEQPYQYVRDTALAGGYGIYSFGPDKRSASSGNDADDFCSWAPDRVVSAPRSWKRISAEIIAWMLFASSLFFGRRSVRYQS